MNTTKLTVVMGCITVALIAVGGASFVSAWRTGSLFDQQVATEYANTRHIVDQCVRNITHTLRVPSVHTTDAHLIILDIVENGSPAELPDTLTTLRIPYSQLNITTAQEIVNNCTVDVLVARHQLFVRKSEYEARLDSWWEGSWMRAAGFPKRPLPRFPDRVSGRG